MAFSVTAYEHVGIRVTDRDRAVKFYETLGWKQAIDLPEHSANEMINDSGIYINLIFNGVARKDNLNILQDELVKHPGITHVAFVIEDMDHLVEVLDRENIGISEGPVIYSNRRKVIFIRDPDGNVLEFNEILDKSEPRDDVRS